MIRGGAYHEPNMEKLLKVYGNLHKSTERKIYGVYTFFDNYGCMQLYYNNDWWEELFREALRAVPAPAMGGAGAAAPAAPTVITPTINMMCLSGSLSSGDKKSVVIHRAKQGLNFILSCNIDEYMDKWNQHPEKGNKNGYYYLGFSTNVHILDNVIILRDGLDMFNYEDIRITQNHYDIIIHRLLNPGLTSQGWVGIKVAYLTRKNIIDKIRNLISKIPEQKAAQLKVDVEIEKLKKQIQTIKSSIGAAKADARTANAAAAADELGTLATKLELTKKTQFVGIPKQFCLFGFVDATIVPVEYIGDKEVGISEENFKKLDLDTRRPTFGNPEFNSYIKGLNNEVAAEASAAAAHRAGAAERSAKREAEKKAQKEADDEAQRLALLAYQEEQTRETEAIYAKQKSDINGAIKEYLDRIGHIEEERIVKAKKDAEEYVKKEIEKGVNLEQWIVDNAFKTYENYLYCKTIELLGVDDDYRVCPYQGYQGNENLGNNGNGEYYGGGRRKTRRGRCRSRSSRRSSSRRRRRY